MREGGPVNNPRKLPWTVPALILIAAVRYFTEGQFDWIAIMALAFVAMRLGSWVSATMEYRRAQADKAEQAKEADQAGNHRSTK
jgi:hypothetical protein